MRKIIIFLLTAIVICSCSKNDRGLSQSTYIPDSEYHELPAYTEWGYNTFGALYNRITFCYSSNTIPLNITIKGDTLTFLLQGTYQYQNDLILKISTDNSHVAKYQDLLTFNDSLIDLTAKNITVEMINNDVNKSIEILEGAFHIKRTQKVFVDESEYGIILSGTFFLKFLENDLPSIISDGRFDLGVNEDNFFDLSKK